MRFLSITTDARPYRDTEIQVLKDSGEFYPAKLTAIRSARKNVNLLFLRVSAGRLAKQFVDALTEQARAGVKVGDLPQGS